MNLGKFSLSVASTNARKSTGSHIPTLTVIGGDVTGKFKLNEAGSDLLNVKSGDYVMLLNNKAVIQAAIKAGDEDLLAWAEENNTSVNEYPVTWAIAPGYVEYDENGISLKRPKPMTNALEAALRQKGEVDEDGKVIAPMIDQIKGARLASHNKAAGVGAICDFTDASVWGLLRGEVSNDKHVMFTIDKEAVQVPVFNGYEEITIDAYVLKFKGVEEVQARTKSATTTNKAGVTEVEFEETEEETQE